MEIIRTKTPELKAAPLPDPEPEPGEAPEVVPTSDELKLASKQAAAVLFGEEVPASLPPPTPGEQPPPAPETPPPADPPQEPATPPAEPEVIVEEPVTPKVIRQIARETVDAMREPAAPPAPEPDAPTPPELSAEDAEDLRIIQFLERTDPKFTGKADAWVDYCRKVYAYQDKWESENTDKDYNPTDEEHADFFKGTTPPVDAHTLEGGKIDMRVEERYEKRVKPEMDKMRARRALEQNTAVIADNVDKGLHRLVKQASPELAVLLSKSDGTPNMTQAQIAEAHKADPIAAAILDETAKHLEPILIELEKSVVMDEQGNYPYKLNPSTNQVHQHIEKYRAQAEANMRNAPPEVRTVNGKQWISMVELDQKVRGVQNSKQSPQQRQAQVDALNSQYWVLTIDHVAELVIDDFGKKAKKLIADTDALAQKKYKPGAPATPSAQPAPSAQPPAAPRLAPVSTARPRPPSFASASDALTTRDPGQPPAKTVGETASEVMWK